MEQKSDLKPVRVKVDLPEVAYIMVLTQRNGTVLDLKKEIERIFRKLLPLSSLSKKPISNVRKDKGRVLLPIWYPIEPLLEDDEEIMIGFEGFGSEIEDAMPGSSRDVSLREKQSYISTDDTASHDILMTNNSPLSSHCACCALIANNLMNYSRPDLDPTGFDPTSQFGISEASQNQEGILEVSRVRKRKLLSPDTTVSDNNHIRVIQSLSETPFFLANKDNFSSPSKSQAKRKFTGNESLSAKHLNSDAPVAKHTENSAITSDIMSDDTVILSRSASDKSIIGTHYMEKDNSITQSFEIHPSYITVENSMLNSPDLGDQSDNILEKNALFRKKAYSSLEENTTECIAAVVAKKSQSPDRNKTNKTSPKQHDVDIVDQDLSFSLDGNGLKLQELEKEATGTDRNDKVAALHTETSQFSEAKRATKAREKGLNIATNDEIPERESLKKEAKTRKKSKRKKNEFVEKDVFNQSQDTMESELGSDSTIFEVNSKGKKGQKNESGNELNHNPHASTSPPSICKEAQISEKDDISSHTSGKKKKKKKKKKGSRDAEDGRSFCGSQSCDTNTVHTGDSSVKSKRRKSKSKKTNASFQQIISDACDVSDDEAEALTTAKKAKIFDGTPKNQVDSSLFKVPKARIGANIQKENASELTDKNISVNSFGRDSSKRSSKSSKKKNDSMANSEETSEGENISAINQNQQKLCFDDETDTEISAIQSNINKSFVDVVHDSDNSNTNFMPLEFKKKSRRSEKKQSASISEVSVNNCQGNDLSSVGRAQKSKDITADGSSDEVLKDRKTAKKENICSEGSEGISMKSELQGKIKNKGKLEYAKSEPSKDSHNQKQTPNIASLGSKTETSLKGKKKSGKKIASRETKKLSAESLSNESSSISFSDVSAEDITKKSKATDDTSKSKKKQEKHRETITGKQAVEGKLSSDADAKVETAKRHKRKKSRSLKKSTVEDACVSKVSAWLSQIPEGNHDFTHASNQVDESNLNVDGKDLDNANESSFSIVESKITDAVLDKDDHVSHKRRLGKSAFEKIQNGLKNEESAKMSNGEKNGAELSHPITRSCAAKAIKEEACRSSGHSGKDVASNSVTNAREDTKAVDNDDNDCSTLNIGAATRDSTSADSFKKESVQKAKKENKFKKKNFIKSKNTNKSSSEKKTDDVNSSFENGNMLFDSMLDDGGSIVSSNVKVTSVKNPVTPGLVQRSISGFLTKADRQRFESKLKHKD